jgi:molybdopterin converting factor small subunit
LTSTIRLPAPLRGFAAGRQEVRVQAETVGEALLELTRLCPGIRRHLYGDDGRLREFVNLFVDELDVRAGEGEATRLRGGETITIVPSIAGG